MTTIDADLHNIAPNIDTLFPYMEPHWREYFGNSRFSGPPDTSYPLGAQTSVRPGQAKTAATTLADVQQNALDPWQTEIGILNCTYEVESLHNPDMAMACARAVNDWVYDIKTGQSWFDPDGVRVRPYPVTVETGADDNMDSGYQPGPYVAESYPVEVDRSYVVVDLSRRA